MKSFTHIHSIYKYYPLESILPISHNYFALTCAIQKFIEIYQIHNCSNKEVVYTNDNKSLYLNQFRQGTFLSQNLDTLFWSNQMESFRLQVTQGFIMTKTLKISEDKYINLSSDQFLRIFTYNLVNKQLKQKEKLVLNFEQRYTSKLIPMIISNEQQIGYRNHYNIYCEHNIQYNVGTTNKSIKDENIIDIMGSDKWSKYLLTNKTIKRLDSRSNKFIWSIQKNSKSNKIKKLNEFLFAIDQNNKIMIHDIRGTLCDVIQLKSRKDVPIKEFEIIQNDKIVLIDKIKSQVEVYQQIQ